MSSHETANAPSKLRSMPNGKTVVASPRLSADEQLEMQNMNNGGTKLPIEEDLFQLARLGETAAIRKLFETGKYDANYKDQEGITALHWAAINNHYATCQYLIESGADVNAKGGEAVATPAMWAVQRCHYYIVNLLLQHGADTTLTDIQGYNLLHLATFDGNIFLMVLLLHQDMPVDLQDPQGHTCLMWAAFKGYPACVDMLLKWGANVHVADENGFTALHWALVKGSLGCIQKLIEYGSDRFVETTTHKTPATVADEMKTTRFWYRALDECGFDDNGNPKPIPFPISLLTKSASRVNKFFFFWPFLILFLVMWILSSMVIYAAIPIALMVAYGMQSVTKAILPWCPSHMRHIHKTPFLAGVFAGSLFWAGVRWMTTILPNTWSTNYIMNMFFGASIGLCGYFYVYTMLENPGYISKLASRSQQKAVIEELLSIWKYDEDNFCMQCMFRRPLRSKHCKRCGRCVAKHDHHCPWVNSCIGANNHRHFFMYILFMEIAIILFVRLTLAHLENLPDLPDSTCNILASSICGLILPDTFTVVLCVWSTLQSVWVTMLLIVQSVQIARAQTTYENMRSHTSVSQSSHAAAAITSSLSGASSMTGAGPDPASHPNHHHHDGFFTQWKKLLGLDTFLATATDTRNSRAGRRGRNPWSRGCFTNCKDFWCDPAPYFGKRESGSGMLDGEIVNYERMYEVPLRMKRRRDNRDVYQRLATVEEGDVGE
ncbi:MAG: palmitoyltransferase akr1 [Cirrosporium novae-zelandiae]|nr:MAG: palmitoyltransferase akr1 [Cirrosporium novae-zelandiae]